MIFVKNELICCKDYTNINISSNTIIVCKCKG